jgi:hypothetical protein
MGSDLSSPVGNTIAIVVVLNELCLRQTQEQKNDEGTNGHVEQRMTTTHGKRRKDNNLNFCWKISMGDMVRICCTRW